MFTMRVVTAQKVSTFQISHALDLVTIVLPGARWVFVRTSIRVGPLVNFVVFTLLEADAASSNDCMVTVRVMWTG